MTVTEAVDQRRATPAFDETVSIERGELLALMNKACLAPSALNLQPWRFLICQTSDEKQRLHRASFEQRKILQASAVVVVLGDLLHHLNAPMIADGNVSPEVDSQEQWVALANEVYSHPDAARDEAFRGGSLWVMTFVMLATEAGWDTSLIGGFDAHALRNAFHVADQYLPVLLVAVGKRSPDAGLKPRGKRMTAENLILHP